MKESPDDDIALIEAYLQHKLDPYLSLKVKKRIRQDRHFAQKVTTFRSLLDSADRYRQQDFNDPEESWDEEIPSNNTVFLKWPLVVAVLALIVTLWYFLPQAPVNKTQKIFTENFQPYRDIISTQNISVGIMITDGLRYYNEQQYDSAANLLQGYLAEIPDRTIEFYLGQSQLARGRGHQALTILEPLATDNTFLLQKEAQWYQALALIQTEATGEALKVLGLINENDQHPYGKKAQEIRQELLE